MKDLDEINPPFARPSRMCSVSAIIPCLSYAAGAALAIGATPEVSFWWNPIAIIYAACSLLSILLFFIPPILNWDWKTEYFGFSLLYLTSAAFGLVPWLSILLYSRLPLIVRLGLFGVYALLIISWCCRFVSLYRKIYLDENMRECIYKVENDAVYYLQKGDGWLLDKKLKFPKFPPNANFIFAWGLALSLMPVMSQVTAIVGLPFTHIVLAIGSIPIDMAMFGLATRGWLVFIHYPGQIHRITGKRVYVDMASKPRNG